jgi:Uncharacterized conserved protein
MKKFLVIIIAAVLLVWSSACTKKTMTEAEQWGLLSEAYRYTFPLVLMNLTMKSSTNTETADLAGHAPVNQLIHSQNLANADSKMVVTPNVDTIYTQAWLDLSDGPMIFVLPETDRFCMTQVLDAWTNTPAILKSGSYLLALTGYTGAVPEGVTLVEIPTSMAWLITRTLINDEDDMENVRTIQNGMRLLPLNCYESSEEYIPPKGEYKEENNAVPINAILSMSPQQYFSAANKLMASNPSPDVDADVLARFAALNIGSGLTFDVSVLQGDIQTNWKQMLGEMKEIVVAKGAEYQVKLGDWNYFGDPIGRFGTAYDYRAMIALGGLGANPTDVAIYAKTGVDVNQKALNGQNNYVLHFESLPPIQEGGFWSVTAYGSDDFLIANELNRYCINDRSAFVLNEDGSLDIQLSDTAPEKQANWLPVGTGDFHLFLRIYLPDTEAVKESWTAPSVTMVLQ